MKKARYKQLIDEILLAETPELQTEIIEYLWEKLNPKQNLLQPSYKEMLDNFELNNSITLDCDSPE